MEQHNLGIELQDDPIYIKEWKYFFVLGFGIIASTFLFIVAIYLLVKIYRIVHFKGDPPLLLSILSISLALFSLMSFFALDMLRILSWGEQPIINFHFEISGTLIN